MTTVAENVWEICDMFRRPDAAELFDRQTLAHASKVVLDHRIELFERPSEKPGVPGHRGMGTKHLEIQRTFFEDQDARIIAVGGANRSAKTVTIGALCVAKWVRDYAPDGAKLWVVAQDTNMMRAVPHRILWEFLPRKMFPPDREYTEALGLGLNPTVTLKTERGKVSIYFKTEEMGLDKYESDDVDLIWWTEAEREAIFDAIQSRIIDRRGRIAIDYLPTQGWHRRRLRLNPDVRHWRVAMIDNAHNLPEGEIERAERNMSERDVKLRIYGEEIASEGVVYREFDEARHVIKPFALDPSWPRYRCMDYGYRNPTALLWACHIPPGFDIPTAKPDSLSPNQERIVIYRELYQTGLTPMQIAGSALQLSEGERYRFDNRVVADPSVFNRNQVHGAVAKSVAELLEENGLRMKPGPTSQGRMHEMVAKVRLWFEHDRILFFDTCKMTIRDHADWSYKEGVDGVVPGQEPFENRNDHACDALRYLICENLTFEQPKAMVINTDPWANTKRRWG